MPRMPRMWIYVSGIDSEKTCHFVASGNFVGGYAGLELGLARLNFLIG